MGHSAMLGELVVMPAAEFDDWIATQRRGISQAADSAPIAGEGVRPGSSLVDEGRRLAGEQGCMKCHSVDGTRHIGPTWLQLYGRNERLQTGKAVVADEGYLTKSIMDPGADVVAGYQNVMPTYQGRLSPPEVAAIVEYIKSLSTQAVRSGPSEGPAYESIPRK
jgi:cytochrome c oxidase subunit 2